MNIKSIVRMFQKKSTQTTKEYTTNFVSIDELIKACNNRKKLRIKRGKNTKHDDLKIELLEEYKDMWGGHVIVNHTGDIVIWITRHLSRIHGQDINLVKLRLKMFSKWAKLYKDYL